MWVGEADGKTFSKFSAFNYFCFNRFFLYIIVFEWGENNDMEQQCTCVSDKKRVAQKKILKDRWLP